MRECRLLGVKFAGQREESERTRDYSKVAETAPTQGSDSSSNRNSHDCLE